MSKEAPEFPFGVRLRIAYDGTDFHGWQFQGHGLRTVQGELEKGVAALGLRAGRIRGASRTDAGVHAQGQVVQFACERQIPSSGLRIGLNGVLPHDIVVTEATTCHRLYNPRFDAEKKLYRYRIAVGEFRDPLTRRQAWQYGPRIARRDQGRERRACVEDYLDVPAMKAAAAKLVGHHDFQAFRAYDDGREHTERTMERVEVIEAYGGQADQLAFEIVGDGFMKNMIRIFAGTLADVGRQRLQPEVIDAMLSPDGGRSMGGPTAPPHGLSLVKIWLVRGDHKRASL